MQRGKLVIVLIFLVATLMSGYAWWHHYSSNRRCHAFWGAQAMVLVRSAKQVEFQPLSPLSGDESADATSTDNHIEINGQRFLAGEPIDVSDASGLVHARYSLVSDASFLWSSAPSDCQPDWRYLIHFRESDDQVTIAIDTSCGHVWWVEGRKQLQLTPKLTTAFAKKGQDWGKK